MILSVVSGLIYIKARRNTEIFSSTIKNAWKKWELRVLVLISLILQMILISFGNRRKYSKRTWIQVLLWCAYLMADWVATVALGVLLNNMGDVYDAKNGDKFNLDPNTQLNAFWAPFLLLHLGGPDTVTAFSLEDNELWLRHFLGFGVQTVVAVYIFLLGWTSSLLSILTMPMLLAGIIKYGERTWSLRSASNEELRDSMITAPDYSKFVEEFTLKQWEGFYVVADEVVEGQVTVDVSSMGDLEGATELLKAHYLFKTFKRLFVDLILSFQDRDITQSLFSQMSCKEAFKVIEIELGFMYDLLYTKGTIIYTRRGYWLRAVTLTTTCIVLVFFSLSDKQNCSEVDVAVTFLLLVIAAILELFALVLLVSTDWTDLCLPEQKGVIRQAISLVQLRRRRRWSNALPQYSLLSYCLTGKPVIKSKIHKLFGIDKILQQQHMTCEQVTDELKDFIFTYLKEKFDKLVETKSIVDASAYQKELKNQCTCRGAHALRNFPALLWSVDVEFDRSIIIWHIATILNCHADRQGVHEQNNERCQKISRSLSQYMLYLLVIRPSMLPMAMGIGKIRYQDTCAEATTFFQEPESIASGIKKYKDTCSWAINLFKHKDFDLYETQASRVLLNEYIGVPPVKVEGERTMSVLFDACRLASDLKNMRKRWEVVSEVWMEMLAYAATHCRGTNHAQQLGRGGELLTHVWLLMAHFGLTEQFQISHGHARVELSVK